MNNPGENIVLATDSYKMTHWAMYPPAIRKVGSYFEARAGGEYPYSVFFGLQYLAKRYFEGQVVTREKIDEARNLCLMHFGQDVFNLEGWEYVLDKYDGRLPVSISAVPEGTVVPESNVLFTIENTDPNCFWLTNHLETLLVELWYPCTVATISMAQKKVLSAGLEKSGSLEKLPFMLHDFGYRGSTSVESAALGDAAHLVNFMGTDTIAGMELLMKYYGSGMPAFSVPAAEHSTITAWGKDREVDAFRHILNRFQNGLVSVVSDSWDIYDACERLWGEELRDEVIDNKDRTLVVRPDSGDPYEVVPACMNILGSKFGFTTNDKGYRVLPDNVRLIQGDGISRHSLPGLLYSIMNAGWSLDNIVFGSGGGLIQDCTRDTLRFAMKCNWVDIDGVVSDVYKRPTSDPTKNSKRGRLALIRHEGRLQTVNEEAGVGFKNELREVFRNGEVLVEDTLDAIRERAVLTDWE